VEGEVGVTWREEAGERECELGGKKDGET